MEPVPVVLKPKDCQNSLHRDDEPTCVICLYRAQRALEAVAVVKKHEHDEDGRYKGSVPDSPHAKRVIVVQKPKRIYIPKIARVQKARKTKPKKVWPEAQIPHMRNIKDYVYRKPTSSQVLPSDISRPTQSIGSLLRYKKKD